MATEGGCIDLIPLPGRYKMVVYENFFEVQSTVYSNWTEMNWIKFSYTTIIKLFTD